MLLCAASIGHDVTLGKRGRRGRGRDYGMAKEMSYVMRLDDVDKEGYAGCLPCPAYAQLGRHGAWQSAAEVEAAVLCVAAGNRLSCSR